MKKTMDHYSQLLLRKVGETEKKKILANQVVVLLVVFFFFLTSGFHVTKVGLLIQEYLGGCQKDLAVFISI